MSVGTAGRIVAFVVLLLVSAIAALQMPNLQVDRSDDKLISKQDAGWAALKQMQADFGK